MRVLSTVCAGMIALLLTAGVAEAAPPAATPQAQTPVGTWHAVVVLGDAPNVKDEADLSYTASGRVCLTTPIAAGTGVWRSDGPTTFVWSAREVFQRNPNYPGYVLINQTATQNGATFSSSGPSLVFDQQGHYQKTITVSLTATRTSTRPAASCAG